MLNGGTKVDDSYSSTEIVDLPSALRDTTTAVHIARRFTALEDVQLTIKYGDGNCLDDVVPIALIVEGNHALVAVIANEVRALAA